MRVEVLGSVQRRRRWSRDDKARIVEETLAPGAKVSEIARRHGISASLVFTWRREARVSTETTPIRPQFAAVRIGKRSLNQRLQCRRTAWDDRLQRAEAG
jgi:transposase